MAPDQSFSKSVVGWIYIVLKENCLRVLRIKRIRGPEAGLNEKPGTRCGNSPLVNMRFLAPSFREVISILHVRIAYANESHQPPLHHRTLKPFPNASFNSDVQYILLFLHLLPASSSQIREMHPLLLSLALFGIAPCKCPVKEPIILVLDSI